jgi:hypothetical protein
MAKKATTVEDVVLGEAKAGSYQDMVAIASVIENRSRQLGKSYEDVVSVQSEFNAYNKALPAGVDKYRDLAQKAIEQVRTQGPVHNATFYATPSATKNLPSGLQKVTSTDGHQYFSDPQMRSIRTVDGFVRPNPANAMPSAVPAPSARPSTWRDPMNIAGDLPGTLYDVQGATPAQTAQVMQASLPDVGPVPTARPNNPSREGLLGLAALASPTDLARAMGAPEPAAGLFDFTPLAKVRQLNVQPEVTDLVQRAVTRLGPEYGWTTTSGGQLSISDPNALTDGVDVPKGSNRANRIGSIRHDLGGAIDGAITKNGQTLNPVTNRREYMNALTNLAEEGAGGLGHYGWGIHADLQSPKTWGPTTSSASLDPGFGLAIDQGRKLSSLEGNYPTPTPRDGSAPVERTMLGGAPASILGDIAMPSAQPSYADTVQAATQATSNFPARPSVPGSMPAAPQPASNFPASPSPSVAGIPAAPAQPAVDMAEMAKQYGMYRPGTVPKSMLDLEDRPLTPAPVQPVQPPPAPVQPTPQPVQREQPAQRPAPPPANTGMDVWQGRANTGIATDGSQLTRNPDGSVTRVSGKYGWSTTERTDPFGGTFTNTTAPGLFGIDRAMSGLFGGNRSPSQGIQGPLTGQGIQTRPAGFMGIPEATTRRGETVRGVGGAVLGGMTPLGLLGAIAGKDIAQGKNPLGADGTVGSLLGGLFGSGDRQQNSMQRQSQGGGSQSAPAPGGGGGYASDGYSGGGGEGYNSGGLLGGIGGFFGGLFGGSNERDSRQSAGGGAGGGYF